MLITPLSLVGLAVAWISPALGAVSAWLIGWLGSGLFTMLDWLVALFPDSVRAPPGPLAVLGLVLGLTWLMLPPRFPGRGAALLLLMPALLIVPAPMPLGSFQAEVLDVGQGLAVRIETADHHLLYDAGPRFGRFDTGEAIVLPALRARGVDVLDRVVISHAARDHAGGLDAVLDRFPRATVVGDADSARGPVRGAVRSCRHGEAWTWDGVRFRLYRAPLGSANNRSCLLRVSGRRQSLLLTGDLEAAGERWLARHVDLRTDVVLVGHHGSLTSSTPRFIEATGARHALVSAGFLNRWGHPRPEVAARWRAAGATVWRTDRDGALQVVGGEVRGLRYRLWPFPWRHRLGE